jgi:uncharacterized protein
MKTGINKQVKRLLAGCLLLLATFTAFAQKGSTKIAVLARPAQDSVALRWAPETAAAWQLLNKNGYTIRRYTILKDGKLLDTPEQVLLTKQPVKPRPMNDWKPLVNADDKYATIAAQALFGTDFTVTQQAATGVGELLNKLQENESRFSFALFSADQSFRVAQMMGLGYVDKTTKANEKYVYRIYPAIADQYVKIDTGFVFTGFADFAPLPKPYDVQVDAQQKGAMVSWNQESFTGVYTTYMVERSVDKGKTFVAVNDAPVVNTSADAAQEVRRATKLDTVSAINRRLIYRVKGISPFGEIGPPSDTVGVIAYHWLAVSPTITRAEAIDNRKVELDWEMPFSEAAILGFDVERSADPDKGFTKINAAKLASTAYTIADLNPQTGNYYRVRAYGAAASTVSFPVFVQLIDSIPPTAPTLLAGEITKEGIVKLSWKDNLEPDLFGYRVYRANSLKEDFVQVTRKAVLTAAFTDTIQVESLARKIYYKVVAVDNRYNPSAFSQPVELKRPDVLPPAPPSFTNVVSQPSGVYLTWNRSASTDVAKQEIYRSQAGQDNWARLAELPDTAHVYADASADAKVTYTYKVRAIDQVMLFSDSKPFSGKKLDIGLMPSVTSFKGTADRTNLQILLRWSYKQPEVESFLLYRAEPGKPMRLYKTLDAQATEYADSNLLINTLYEYRLKVIFTDGSESGFSKLVQVNY